MGVKTAGVGHFTIPTAPAAGTSVTSGAANAFSASYVQLIASTSAALYITGIHLEAAAAKAATYIVVQLATGGAGSETVVGQYLVPLSTASTVALGYRQIYPPIPVATTTRIAVKTADSVGTAATLVTLEVIAQSNVVDDGITVGTVNLVNTLTTYTGNTVQTGDSFARLGAPVGASHSADVAAVKVDTAAIKVKTDFLPSATAGADGGVFIAGTNAATTVNFTGNLSGSVGSVTGAVGSVTGAVGSVTGLTASNLDAAVSSRMATFTQPTGFLAATFPLTLASTTNITAGTITTVTNLTNAPTAGDLTATMKASVTTAATAATPTAAAVTGAVGSVTGNVGGNVVGSVGSVTGAVGSVTGNVGGNVVGTVASVVGAVGSVTGLTVANLDAAVSTRLATAGYTAPLDAAGTRTAVGLATGNLDTQIGTLATAASLAAAKTDTAAIKAKTDSLAFTVAGQVDTNIKSVAGTTVTGSGTAGSPWGP